MIYIYESDESSSRVRLDLYHYNVFAQRSSAILAI